MVSPFATSLRRCLVPLLAVSACNLDWESRGDADAGPGGGDGAVDGGTGGEEDSEPSDGDGDGGRSDGDGDGDGGPPRDCSPTCENDGVCVARGDDMVCSCSLYFTGPACADDVDECTTAACPTEYPCLNTRGGHTCAGQLLDFPISGRNQAHFASYFEPHHPLGHAVLIDRQTGLMWERIIPYARQGTWQESKALCENLEFAGYTDWRMPSLLELYTTVVSDDLFIVDSMLFDRPENQWTTAIPTLDGDALKMGFYLPTGAAWGREPDESAAVTCVRTHVATFERGPNERYRQEAGQVHDLRTGLTFKESVPAPMTYSKAVEYCQELAASEPGFRMPTALEIATTFDASGARRGAGLASVYKGLFGCYWSSTRPASGTSYVTALASSATLGLSEPDDACYIRCVK